MLTREQVELLQRWGTGLENSGSSEELKSAGRAIRLLVEYIEATERGLWHERAGVSDRLEAEDSVEPVQARGETSIYNALTKRIGPHL